MSTHTSRTTDAAVPRPSVAPPAEWSFPTPERTALPNGVDLITYDIPGQYVLSLRLVMPVSLWAEPRDKEGVGLIMTRMLDEGTATYTSEQFARLLERKGVSLGAGISDAGLGVDVDVVKGGLESALDLLRQVLVEPVFPEVEAKRHIRTRLAEIEQERASAGHRASLEFVATYYDSANRAARPIGGDADTVAAITRDDIAAFHAAHVRAAGATIVVAGDLEGLDVPALVAAELGDWQAGPDRSTVVEEAGEPSSDRARVVIVDRPGSVQSELIIGSPGPDRDVDGGWAPHPVIAFALGGSPNARIDALLREDKGYTYGIRSGFRPRRVGGLFMTSGSVRSDATVESLRLLVDLLTEATTGFTDKEIKSGVDFIGKTAPGRFDTADSVADEAISMAMDGRTTQFTTDNLRDLATVDRERADAAYRRFAERAGLLDRPGHGWTIIVVGDAAEHADAIRALDIGEVTVVKD